jgi:transcriptional regulator with XRE-family HTH domain
MTSNTGDTAGQANPADPGDAADDRWQKQLNGLGGFIRMQRRLADMSLREMASITSVSNAYLSQIERGLHQPSLRVLRSIAQALRITPEELLRRANFMAPKDGADKETPADEVPGTRPVDTEAAILADPKLTPEQRAALLNVYRNFRGTS